MVFNLTSTTTLLTILRPVNALAAGLASLVGYVIATGTLISGSFFLFLVVFLITGAGYVINDYFDREIDKINRPLRPIPQGKISDKGALIYSVILFIAGISISLTLGTFCAVIALFNSVLLIIYSLYLKRTAFIGNVAVAYLSASMFLFGGAYFGINGIILNIPIAGITFCAMISREILKDAEDIKGDMASGALTLPGRIGIGKSLLIALFFTISAVIISFVPFSRWGLLYCSGIIPVDLIVLYGAIKPLNCKSPECVKNTSASHFQKYGMFLSLIVFLVSALLLT